MQPRVRGVITINAVEPWAVLIASGALSLALCAILTPVARYSGLMDHPSDRKVHRRATPLVGGLAIYMSMAIAILVATPYGYEALPLLLACGLMLLTGIMDDLHDLSPHSRFALQILACLIMIFGAHVVLNDFGWLMWDGVFRLGLLSIPITVFAVLGVINAFNMMDGIDGLSSMIFIVAAIAMAWLALRGGHGFNATVLIIAAGATLGFFALNARLPWNKRARVFLGDSGSMMLGLLLAWQFVDLGNGDDRPLAPITAVWLLGVPLIDTLRLMTQRWRRGGSSMQADQFHLHHAFLKAGFSVAQTGMAITVLVLFTTAIGISGHIRDWPEYLMFYGYVIFGLAYMGIMHHCWHHGRFLGRDVATELS